MPTINDLHDAFAELEANAPTELPDRHRPSRLPMLAAAAVVLAVAIAALAIGVRHDSGNNGRAARSGSPGVSSASRTAPTDRPAQVQPNLRQFTFTVGALRGVRTEYTDIDRRHQGAEIDLSGHDQALVGWVNVYPAGGAKPTRPTAARAATVNGHPGFSGYLPPDTPGMMAVSDGPGLFAIAWEYAKGAWAVVQQDYAPAGVTAPSALRIARAVTFGTSHPVYVAAEIGYLPAGFELSGIRNTTQNRLFTSTTDFAADGTRVPMSVAVTTSTIGMGQSGSELGPTTASRRGVAISFDNWHGWYDGGCGSIWLQRAGVDVSISTENALGVTCHNPHVLNLDQLKAIVAQVTLARDAVSGAPEWFTADVAIP